MSTLPARAGGPTDSCDWSELPASLRGLLDDEELRMVASTYGYDLA